MTLLRADPQSNKEARKMVEKARDILHQLKQRISLTTQQKQWLEGCDADLKAMQEASRGAELPKNR